MPEQNPNQNSVSLGPSANDPTGVGTTDPVALLRETARLLRERAAAAPDGPWWPELSSEDDEWRVSCPPPQTTNPTFADGWYVAAELGESAARWIALTSPVIAKPLAKIMDDCADTAERIHNDGDLDDTAADDLIDDLFANALELARLICEAVDR